MFHNDVLNTARIWCSFYSSRMDKKCHYWQEGMGAGLRLLAHVD